MKANHKWTVLAMAIAALTTSAAASAADDDKNASANIDHQHKVTEIRENIKTNITTEANLKLDASLTLKGDYEDTQKTTSIQSDERKEKNNHGVDVNLQKDLRLSSNIMFSGRPTVTGNIDLDSAAIAVVDNRQSITENWGINGMLTNDASITDDVGSNASGNLGFNVSSGDNNAQDNAAALSAADASFSFGLADAEVFVNQLGADNLTNNNGVTNTAGLSGNAFANASGNIGVNVTSGNNNMQKNALAASVATTAYANATVSSNQVSNYNTVSNSGEYQRLVDTIDINMSGEVSGTYEGSGAGDYNGTGMAYQANDFYPDIWSADEDNADHPVDSPQWGHVDFDSEAQGAYANPLRDGAGGLAMDTEEEGELGFEESGDVDLLASLSGQIVDVTWVAVNAATNTASLSGSAFSGASGNIGVNVSSGTGNMQANSLAMAVAQPAATPTDGGTTPPGG